MTATLPQLWLLDLARLSKKPAAGARSCPVFRPSANGARLPAAGRSTARALPAQAFCCSRRSRQPVSPFLIRSSPKTNGESRALSLTPSIFSLSHAGNFCVCALDSSPLGVDVELPRISMAVAARCFHPDEAAFLQTLPEEAQKDALLRLWTARKAISQVSRARAARPARSVLRPSR